MPVLGVCVGMQIMANYSEEGILEGLGWIPGIVKKFKEAGATILGGCCETRPSHIQAMAKLK